MATDVKPNLPVDEVFSLIAKATKEWQDKNKGDEITKAVFKRLDSSRDEVIAKLLGFDFRWNKWELDHCNGRSGNSFIGKLFSEGIEKQVRDWVNKNTNDLNFSSELTKAMINDARREYKDALRQALRDEVHCQASAAAKKIIDELSGSQTLSVINELEKFKP